MCYPSGTCHESAYISATRYRQLLTPVEAARRQQTVNRGGGLAKGGRGGGGMVKSNQLIHDAFTMWFNNNFTKRTGKEGSERAKVQDIEWHKKT
ncbi:hypothetical protein BUALT_Bualt02G0114600 [Buddleja alternifolia]|uniref:Uncharacterized protein n=1 Tax=Buddleja alternifolia TaxID=168488 RepID=A0AAV6XZG9_9LAMI|nr:hypothetical protein BUALT_Bualt02G0114600 [Buddleja alternifolia]